MRDATSVCQLLAPVGESAAAHQPAVPADTAAVRRHLATVGESAVRADAGTMFDLPAIHQPAMRADAGPMLDLAAVDQSAVRANAGAVSALAAELEPALRFGPVRDAHRRRCIDRRGGCNSRRLRDRAIYDSDRHDGGWSAVRGLPVAH